MVDLNCDLGEGFGVWRITDDDALLAIVTSANVACGFHAGDPPTMRHVCAVAAERGVTVGAQVSYRDRAGFGRRFIAASYAELRDDVTYQLGALDAFCRVAGTRVRYLKPHGALYHACSTVPDHAHAVLDAMRAYDAALFLLAAAGSPFANLAADAGVTVVAEAFADRRYTDEGTLVARAEVGALITDPVEAATQARSIAVDGLVTTISGAQRALSAASICVHSDTPDALTLAGAVRSALLDAHVPVQPFA